VNLRRGRALGAAAMLAAAGAGAPAGAQKPSANLHEVWSTLGDSGVFVAPQSIVVTSDCTVWIADPRSGLWRLSCNFGGAPVKVEADSAGPHNLQIPWLVAPFRGDTVAVWDRGAARIALFAPGGTFLRAQPAPLAEATTGLPLALSVPLSDGTVRAWTLAFPGSPGARRDPRSYVITMQPDGAVRDSLLAVSGPQSTWYDTAGLYGHLPAPLQRKPFVTFFQNGGFIAGTNATAQLTVYDSGGHAQRTISLPLQPPPRVTTLDRDAFLDSARKGFEREMEQAQIDDTVRAKLRDLIAPLLRDATYPEVRQQYDQLLLDEGENTVWVLLPGSGATYDRTWLICSLSEYSFCRTQTIPHQGAVLAVAIRGAAVYAIEQARDGLVRIAKYDSQ
jgi:hypothetical protein